MSAHAKLSPSAAHRWMHCPGSIALCATVPRRPSGKYADEGSAAHYVAEKSLHMNVSASRMIGRKVSVGKAPNIQQILVTEEMATFVQTYLDHVEAQKAGLVSPICQIEQRLVLDHWIPGGFGTGDFIAIEQFGTLYITDLKYGAGVPVDVRDNPQLMIYALGAIGSKNLWDVEEVVMTIVQPRAAHHEGPVRSHRMDVPELLAWGEEVLIPGAKACAEPGAKLCSGEWCRWCDAQAVCPEIRKKSLEAVGAMFDDHVVPNTVLDLPHPGALTPAQQATIYAAAEVIEPWLKAVKGAWQEHLRTFGPSEGWKLVQGRATRKWADPKFVELEAGDLLGEEIYEEPKLRSPAQMEKLLKSKGIEPKTFAHLVSESRGVSVAREADPRPALPPGVEAMFSEE